MHGHTRLPDDIDAAIDWQFNALETIACAAETHTCTHKDVGIEIVEEKISHLTIRFYLSGGCVKWRTGYSYTNGANARYENDFRFTHSFLLQFIGLFMHRFWWWSLLVAVQAPNIR